MNASMEIQHPKILEIMACLSGYLYGKDLALKLALITCCSRGHLLIEDLPGLGKTVLALSIARVLGLTFGRIQCTSDLLPTDITGLSIYNKNTAEFEFRPGPVFNHIVLVDEINRATPKTQSALLEAMGEKQTTIEGKTYLHPQPFFVIATQNPVEHFGTFPLPESQMDRFMMQIRIGYPSGDEEKEILKQGSSRRELDRIDPLVSRDEVVEMHRRINTEVHVSEKILGYILDIVAASRHHPYIRAGISTRGALAVTASARTYAFFCGRDFVIPEDIRELAPFTLPHRLLLKEEYESLDKKELVQSILDTVKVPA
ncbi:MAG: MoxR family ATPase [Syntrophales bacterium]|jgi:MoxR-like ATPase|nr:MoxR family ATPase [Syntrophales bacterium]MDD4339780.1 MoxR family ATPase [Syntrophales bacterium]HOG07610.1 MoxR family ATPase [Syntrophales bacterium]HOS77627.1 MoxR family ATPase [Syntrophales bacterium]HPB70727.1 MoxR family ATPase [Syntrophales bacterium]